MSRAHNEAVYAFFAQCKERDPDGYAAVCARYPVMSRQRIRLLREREQCAGLIGLQPAPLSEGDAFRHGLDMNHDD